MASLAEFLKGTVGDSLNKVLQPSGLLPGALLVLLNLGFVLPAATTEEVPVAVRLSELDSGWQAVVLGALILGVGFLVLSASNVVLDTLTGATWRPALVARVLRKARDMGRARLKARTTRDARRGDESTEQLDWHLHTRRAPAGQDSSSTALGDALLAAGDATSDRYGLRMATLWEPLRAALDRDNVAVTAADAEKAVLSLAGNLTFVLGIYAVESAVVLSLLHHWNDVLMSLLVLPVAYVAYRVTVVKAISWADAVDTVAALHRDTLRERLGMRKPRGFADAHRQFEQLSAFMPGTAAPGDDMFEASRADVEAPDGLLADLASAPARTPAAGVDAREHCADVRCLLVATCADAEDHEHDEISVSDARVPHLRAVPAGLDDTRATLVPGSPDALRGRFDGLGSGDTRERAFALPRWTVELSDRLTGRVEEPDERRLEVAVTVPGDKEVADGTLTLFHALARDGRVTATSDGRALKETTAPSGASRWKLGRRPPDGLLRVELRIEART